MLLLLCFCRHLFLFCLLKVFFSFRFDSFRFRLVARNRRHVRRVFLVAIVRGRSQWMDDGRCLASLWVSVVDFKFTICDYEFDWNIVRKVSTDEISPHSGVRWKTSSFNECHLCVTVVNGHWTFAENQLRPKNSQYVRHFVRNQF